MLSERPSKRNPPKAAVGAELGVFTASSLASTGRSSWHRLDQRRDRGGAMPRVAPDAQRLGCREERGRQDIGDPLGGVALAVTAGDFERAGKLAQAAGSDIAGASQHGVRFAAERGKVVPRRGGGDPRDALTDLLEKESDEGVEVALRHDGYERLKGGGVEDG